MDNDIIKCIIDNKYITIPEMSAVVGKSEPTVYRQLDSLIKLNVLRRVGSRKNGYWELLVNY